MKRQPKDTKTVKFAESNNKEVALHWKVFHSKVLFPQKVLPLYFLNNFLGNIYITFL